jgi:hypothetical protein
MYFHPRTYRSEFIADKKMSRVSFPNYMFVECEGNNFTGGKSPNNTNMIKQKKKKK